MKTVSLPAIAARVLISLLSVGAIASLHAQPTLAQTTAQPTDLFQSQDNSRDPFTNNGSGSNSGLFDLIHRATLGNTRSMGEFTLEQRDNLNSAAADFRTLQLQLLKKQQAQGQTAPAAAPTATPSTPQ